MPSCAVRSCANFRVKGKSNFHYFRFPKDKETQNRWIQLCGRKDHINPQTQRVCSKHFEQSAFQRNMKYELLGIPVPPNCKAFKPGAVPSLHLPSDTGPPVLQENRPPTSRPVPDLKPLPDSSFKPLQTDGE